MNWKSFIVEESQKDYFIKLTKSIQDDSKSFTIYPRHKDVFRALSLCPMNKIKVVILGQDPYHGEGQAHGLAFSVQKGIAIPPSLVNIFKELKSDLGNNIPSHGCLESWAQQGVLLLNSTLTVRKGEANSHKNFGWQHFTDAIISKVNGLEQPIVYLLWGSFAKNKQVLINNPLHLVITSAHPSPLSAHNGFFGSKPFSKVNNFLIEHNIDPIEWEINNE